MASQLDNLEELLEARETIRAIRQGEVDAFVVERDGVCRIATLNDADTPYRRLVESMGEGAVTVFGDGTVLFCNARFAMATGRRVADIVGTNVTHWLSLNKAIAELLLPSLHGELRFDAVLRGARGFVPASVSVCALPTEAGPTVYCLIVSDVSDRVSVEHLRAEQRVLARERAELGAIFDGLPFAVLVADATDFSYMNPAAEGLLARTPQLAARVREAASRMLADGGSQQAEIAVEERAFQIHLSRLEMAAPAPRALIVIDDVTAAREALRSRQREEQLRETFIGILGHDLRNPLMAMVGAARMLETAPTHEQREHAARLMDRSIERMRHLVDDMLDLTLARIGGGIPIAPDPTDVGEVTRAAIEELGSKEPRLDFVVDRAGDLRGLWDSERLGQVIGNLLANAVKHGDATKPIRVGIDGRDPSRVRLSVTNQGKPIAPERLATIFDPFQQGLERRGSRGGGVGLGLYIAEQIVKAHRGAISVTSTAAGGTTFVVELPRSSAPDKAR